MLQLSIDRRHIVRRYARQDESAAAEVMPISRELDTTPEGVPECSQPGDVLSAEGNKMPEVPGTADWTLVLCTKSVSQIRLVLNPTLHLCANIRLEFGKH